MPIEHADRQPSEALNTIARTTLSNLVLKVAPSTLATWKLEGVSDFALVMFLKITLMTLHFKHRQRHTFKIFSGVALHGNRDTQRLSSFGPANMWQVHPMLTKPGLGLKRPSIPAAEFFVRVNPEHSKKGRTQAKQKDSEKFALKGNPDTSPAANPPLLLDHPLREDQRPSLAWMLDKEDGKRDLVRNSQYLLHGPTALPKSSNVPKTNDE
jgi:hypothetical protein